MSLSDSKLLQKYNVAGPRYTSYPTVPYWEQNIEAQTWLLQLKKTYDNLQENEGISLYIHLPFCEKLCTYCGCNKHITKNHTLELPHINCIIKEWKLYTDFLKGKPLIKEIHLGGGTPTFFSPENLKYLMHQILSMGRISEYTEFSFEGHPNSTTLNHLEALNSVGFKRISLGVQDFNEKVQKAINRVQSFKQVKNATENARKCGYTSVNFDLIYGLPFQTVETMQDTITKAIALKPERIAFYSYAHVPWLKPSQRGYSEDDLPQTAIKRQLYETGKNMFLEAGYIEIGMDHFALPKDALCEAMLSQKLHRNFMGYTPTHTPIMIGLGVSSISDSWSAFAQNVKTVKEYESIVCKNEFPFLKGHLLTSEDLILRKHILNLMCRFETNWNEPQDFCTQIPLAIEKLKEAQNDKLLIITPHGIKLTVQGIPFVRNICMAFDARLMLNTPQTQLFSSTV